MLLRERRLQENYDDNFGYIISLFQKKKKKATLKPVSVLCVFFHIEALLKIVLTVSFLFLLDGNFLNL